MSDKWPATIAKLIEDKANGSAVVQMLAHEIVGIVPVNPEGARSLRLNPVAAI
jgi:phage terminase large subunit-like protein